MNNYLEFIKEKREEIIKCCIKGNYILCSYKTENILRGDFFDDIPLESISNRDEIICEQKRMFSEFSSLLRRLPGLFVKQIPLHVIKFRASPQYPTLLFNSSCFSGMSTVLQLFFVIHPIRKLYLHARWKDGVPAPNKNTKLLDAQTAHLHAGISYLFDKMLRYCSTSPSKILPDSFVQECYEVLLFKTENPLPLSNINPNTFLTFFFDLFDSLFFEHPAFKKTFIETFFTRYTDNKGESHQSYFIELNVDASLESVFSFDQILFSHSFENISPKIKHYESFSEYLLFFLRYDMRRKRNSCILEETLLIPGTDQVFDLVAAIYSYLNTKGTLVFRVLVKYCRRWYLIFPASIIEIDFEVCKEDIFMYDILHTVLYKKKTKFEKLK